MYGARAHVRSYRMRVRPPSLPPFLHSPLSLCPVRLLRTHVRFTHVQGRRKSLQLCGASAQRPSRSTARQAGQSSSQDEEMVVPLPPLSEQEEPVQLTALCTHTANQRDLSSFSLAHLGSVRPPRLFKSRRKDAEAAPPTQRG